MAISWIKNLVRQSDRTGSRLLGAITIVVAAWLGSPQSAYGQRALVEAAVHLKVLAYDRNLVTEGRKRIILGILYPASSGDPAQGKPEVASAFPKLSRKVTVQGIPVVVVEIPVDQSSLTRDLREANVDVIYVSSSLHRQTAAIARVAAELKLPTLCGSSSQLAEGLAVAVDVSGRRPKITVNLAAARASGMDLSARLLRMARVLK